MHVNHLVEVKFQFELCNEVFAIFPTTLIVTFGILEFDFYLDELIDDVAPLIGNPKYATFHFEGFEYGHYGLGLELDEF